MEISKIHQLTPARTIGSVYGIGSPFPAGNGSMPASDLQTVLSITHPDHLILQSSFYVTTVSEMVA